MTRLRCKGPKGVSGVGLLSLLASWELRYITPEIVQEAWDGEGKVQLSSCRLAKSKEARLALHQMLQAMLQAKS